MHWLLAGGKLRVSGDVKIEARCLTQFVSKLSRTSEVGIPTTVKTAQSRENPPATRWGTYWRRSAGCYSWPPE
jgi:hypothetical protein